MITRRCTTQFTHDRNYQQISAIHKNRSKA